jgi:hypothetical protein
MFGIEVFEFAINNSLCFGDLVLDEVGLLGEKIPRLVVLTSISIESWQGERLGTSFGSVFVHRKLAIASIFECCIRICVP